MKIALGILAVLIVCFLLFNSNKNFYVCEKKGSDSLLIYRHDFRPYGCSVINGPLKDDCAEALRSAVFAGYNCKFHKARL